MNICCKSCQRRLAILGIARRSKVLIEVNQIMDKFRVSLATAKRDRAAVRQAVQL